MKIVIIEDEELTASDLAETLLKINPDIQILSVLNSVKEAISYFDKNNVTQPDLIFSDIQLGDGLCFEIFSKINYAFPIIFCTAYDEYALSAFKTNGIDYILKPFSENSIIEALNKYSSLKEAFSKDSLNYSNIINLFKNKYTHNESSVLIFHQDKILPVKINNIALFYVENSITYLLTFDQTKQTINKTLDELANITSAQFYRANRQHLINRNAIKNASQYFSRKLSISLTIPYKETITVSKEKVTGFLEWLSAN